jgi:hypothetical protein
LAANDDNNRRARLENAELAAVQLLTTVLISVGAVMASVGYGFTLGELSDFPQTFSNETPESQMIWVAGLIQYAGVISYGGIALIITGTISGIVGIGRVRRRILNEGNNAVQERRTRTRQLRHLQWWYRFEELH